MKKITTSLLLVSALALSSTQAATIVNFTATTTATETSYGADTNLFLEEGSSYQDVNVAYDEVATGGSAGIKSRAGAGLRLRSQNVIGEVGSALYAFDLGGSFNFGAEGVDDAFSLRISANEGRLDTGTGTRLSLLKRFHVVCF